MHQQTHLSPGEALYLASRMEQKAISLYKRALLVFAQGDMKPVIEQLIVEEEAHKAGFDRLLASQPELDEQRKLDLECQAGSLLFEGGLTGAVREGAFDSALSLLRFAADEEERAAARYHQLARENQGEVREAFLLIAQQEEIHLANLIDQVAALSALETADE